ncbi:peptidoglycan editing factor PgeF [Tepidibacter aestuarii]|uniref:peptidoglycan editing factor PgeF n=1 Tax=Tepidibacter aestuarii TaxID=2925782 RepID=UPI0020BE7DDF|nr:peptidoglycan editing factor PgeF [Tepidibacter aestuarii]CAH2212761.1 Purine nucleoside phosphorylase [Tepidibacter aestuarii]
MYIDFNSANKCDFAKVIFTTKELDMSLSDDREKLCENVNFNFDNLTYNKQVHGNDVVVVDENNIGNIEEADGIITNIADVPIMVFVADCVSIAFIDVENKVIGCVHAGWRGTYKEISSIIINKMKNIYKSKVENIKCIIGPAIDSCCYEVSHDLVEKFNTKFTNLSESLYIMRDEKYYLDLFKINELILIRNGIKRENIFNPNLCTYCDENTFHSYRRENGTSKRMAMVMQIL